RRLGRCLGVQRGDLVELPGQHGGEPRALGPARGDEAVERRGESGADGGGDRFAAFLGLRAGRGGAQHAGQREQRLGARRGAARDARLQGKGERQSLFEGGGIGGQLHLLVAP